MYVPALATAVLALATSASAWDYNQPKNLTNTAKPSPPALAFGQDGTKLVYDAAHPYKAPGPTDLRGPCPGLNTLANHGYLPRNGIATPQQIVTAVQEGFNLGNDVATMLAFGAFMVDGNPYTNLMSLGPKSNRVGWSPHAPPNKDNGAPAAGLNTHGVFEGDVSTTRGDYYFGDNFSFNETLFQQFVAAANKYGNGYYDVKAAGEVRYNRILDSMARNPTFEFRSPRFTTAYAESAFPYLMWTDGRALIPNRLNTTDARSFYQPNKFPDGFYRRSSPLKMTDFISQVFSIYSAHPVKAGYNTGAGNYTVDPTDPGFTDFNAICYIAQNAAQRIPNELYPNATGVLREIMRDNFKTFYAPFQNLPYPFTCTGALTPFGN